MLKTETSTDFILKATDKALEGGDATNWVINNLPIGVIVLSPCPTGYKAELTNDFFNKTFNINSDDIVGSPINMVENLPLSAILHEKCKTLSEQITNLTFEWENKLSPLGQTYFCSLVARLDNDGNIFQILGIVSDRTSEKRAEKNLLHNALHDGLTELPNRILFQEHVEDAINASNENQQVHCAVMIMDVDRFKLINETLGHMAGDEFLIAFAARLKRAVDNKIILARLNSDEFAFLLTSIDKIDDVIAVSDKVHHSLLEPFQLGKSEFYATVSIGIATTISSLPYPEELARDADFAMHSAKQRGKSRSEIYQRASHDKARSQFLLEIELRKAVDNKQLLLYYQPIFDLQTDKLVAFEALCRWNHPERGLVPPDEFIPIAEETGIIVDLGRWALETACLQLKEWRTTISGAEDLGVTVNVSNAQFRKTNVADDTAKALKISGLPGDALRLELTETVIMENPIEAVGYLEEIKLLNVGLALDDFGTGYSSLGSLQNFPLDVIKIDRSFVTDIECNESNYKIVEIITQLSNTLGLIMVAEGIEKTEHVEVLKLLGCQLGQGYLLSRPLTADDADAIIRKLC
jgi:diguanylate cyclase (GGDEF)-like protein